MEEKKKPASFRNDILYSIGTSSAPIRRLAPDSFIHFSAYIYIYIKIRFLGRRNRSGVRVDL